MNDMIDDAQRNEEYATFLLYYIASSALACSPEIKIIHHGPDCHRDHGGFYDVSLLIGDYLIFQVAGGFFAFFR